MDNNSLIQMKQRITELSAIGKDASGGITRLSYSPEYLRGQALIRQYMEQAGMTVELDGVGNLMGTYAGMDKQLAPIMVGSHLDTVPVGGAFDGALGIITAIECIHNWNQANWRPARTVKVIATIEEEGTLFGLACLGSRVLAGEFSDQKQQEIVDRDGRSLADYLSDMGLNRENYIAEAGRVAQLHCFLELHVEQGAELEAANVPVGIVSAIVGIDRIGVSIRGESNHAGTTRMERRKDSLVAAAGLISYIHAKASAANGEYVATVGKLDVYPNAENVVPGEVCLTIEIRAEESAVIDAVRKDIFHFLGKLEQQYHVVTQITKHNRVPPVKLNEKLIACLGDAAERLALPYRKLPSWAGHDAMIFAKLIPAAMIFVPSIDGISHSPAEASDFDAILKATQVLDVTLKGLAASNA